MFNKRAGNSNKLFDELRNWRGAIDTPSYAHAVNERLPYLSEKEIVFLWERAVSEQKSHDSERQWFGEITMGNIFSYLPDNLRKQNISRLDLNTFSNEKVKTIFLLHLSEFSTGETREALQKEAWMCSISHINDPVKNTSDTHAFALEWSGREGHDKHLVWIDTIIDKYDIAVINDIWSSYITQAQLGKIEHNDEFVSQIFHLARKLPRDIVLQACYDCYDVYKSAGRIEKIGQTIAMLITRLPDAEQSGIWKSVIEFGLKQQPSFVSWNEPKKLARYVEKIMPNSLWLETML